jgi:hypothetical protein
VLLGAQRKPDGAGGHGWELVGEDGGLRLGAVTVYLTGMLQI